MFKNIFNILYNAMTLNGYDEERMYGNGHIYMNIPTVSGHRFSCLFVNCRTHYIDSVTGKEKTFGTAEEIHNIECIFNEN